MVSITDKLRDLGIKPLNGEDFTPFSEEEVAAIESVIHESLPDDYRRCLLQFGGSMFSSEINCTPADMPLIFGCFFPFAELSNAIDFLKETLPDTLLPIGDDGGDIVFCLGFRGDDTGKMYIHNTHIGWDDDASRYLERGELIPSRLRYQAVQQIAPSFKEFIKNMKVGNEPE